ncbi:MAG: hypothetical protein FJ279_13015, partial [Planctomycetes bacterium]|nr:hypothetical protein [Planctomycetota bacterium]
MRGLLLVSSLCSAPLAVQGESGPLGPWRDGVEVSPVLPGLNRHSVHANHLASPESPDGKWVLLYTSGTPEGHVGELRVVERATGKARVLVENVTVEDIHRAACQQWVSGGRRVVFHDCRQGEWLVVCVEMDTGRERVLARERQLGWGQPWANLVPLYGPHWNPGGHPDLELLDVESGTLRTVLKAEAVRAAYAEWATKTYGDRPLSIFFPVLSPDLSRVFFKLATPGGGDFRSAQASIRKGLFCYDLPGSRFVYMQEYYGHPAWHADSRTLLWTSVHPGGFALRDTGGGVLRPPRKRLPSFPGSHPACGPGGRLFTVDTELEPFDGPKGHWGVVVGDLEAGDYLFVHKFDNARGAASWRRSHPHPVFSPDGNRLYFNVNATAWTELYVAACR